MASSVNTGDEYEVRAPKASAKSSSGGGASGDEYEVRAPSASPSLSASPTTGPLARTPANYAKEIGGGGVRGVENVVGGLWQTVAHPIDTATGIVKQTKEAHEAKEKARLTGEGVAGQTLELASHLPIVGGMVQHAMSGGTRMASPESFGAASEYLTSFEGPKVAGKAVGKIGDIPKVNEFVRGGVQSAFNAGKDIVHRAGIKLESDTARVNTINETRAVKHAEKVAKIDSDHAAKVADIKAKHSADTAADKATRETKLADAEADHAAKTQAAHDEWVEESHKTLADERLKKSQVAHRKSLETAQKSYAESVMDNLESTYNNIGESFKKRWDGMRKFVGDHATVQPAPILAAIEEARKGFAGTPESKAILDQIEKNISEESGKGGEADESGTVHRIPRQDVSFQEGRTNAHAILEDAYNATDGNTRRLLFKVYEAYDKQLRQTVGDAGVRRSILERDPAATFDSPPTPADAAAGEQAIANYDKLKGDWSQFKTDWDDKGNVHESASTLVHARKIKGRPSEMTKAIEGDVDGVLRRTLGRYVQYGARPDILDEMRATDKQIKGLPEDKVVTEVPSVEKGLAATEPQPPPTTPSTPSTPTSSTAVPEGTAEAAAADNANIQQAKQELGANASLSDILRRAQTLKEERIQTAKATQPPKPPATPTAIQQRLESAGGKPFQAPLPSKTLTDLRKEPSPRPEPPTPPRPPDPATRPSLVAKARDITRDRGIMLRTKLELWKSLRPLEAMLIMGTPLASLVTTLAGGGSHVGMALSGAGAIIAEKAMVHAMDNPRFIQWAEAPHLRDIGAMSHMPPEIQAALRVQIDKFFKAKEALGKPVKVSPVLKSWLLGKLPVAAKVASRAGMGHRDSDDSDSDSGNSSSSDLIL